MTNPDPIPNGRDRTPASNMIQDTTWNHPIDEQYVLTPSHSELSKGDIHRWLEHIELYSSAGDIKVIADAASFGTRAESGDIVGTYTNEAWERDIFPRLGLTLGSSRYDHDYVEEARSLLQYAHESHAVNELDMDQNEGKWMLVASTNPTQLQAELDLTDFTNASSFKALVNDHELLYGGVRITEISDSVISGIQHHEWVPIDDRDLRLSTGCNPITGKHLNPRANGRKGYAGRMYLAGQLNEIEPLCRDIFDRAQVKTEEVHPSPRENESIADILLRHAYTSLLPPEPHAQTR